MKSLRSAAITQLSLHPRSTIFEVTARSGHKTGTNLDSYIDPDKLERTLPGAKVLSEHASVNQTVEIPAPWWLPSPK